MRGEGEGEGVSAQRNRFRFGPPSPWLYVFDNLFHSLSLTIRVSLKVRTVQGVELVALPISKQSLGGWEFIHVGRTLATKARTHEVGCQEFRKRQTPARLYVGLLGPYEAAARYRRQEITSCHSISGEEAAVAAVACFHRCRTHKATFRPNPTSEIFGRTQRSRLPRR